MKKLLFTALFAVTIAVSAFATDADKVSAAAYNNFKATFRRAGDVSWTISKDYTTATFLYNNIRTQALYTPEGEFIGTNTAVAIEDLPLKAKRTFAKKYDGYTVKEAIRFEGNEEGAFFIAAENEKEAVVLKVTDYGQVSVVKYSEKK